MDDDYMSSIDRLKGISAHCAKRTPAGLDLRKREQRVRPLILQA